MYFGRQRSMLGFDIKNYIIVGLVSLLLSLGIFSFFQWLEIGSLKKKKEELVEIKVAYESAILYQNEEVESHRVNKEKALMQLDKWNALPAKIKWRTIEEKVYVDVNITTNKEATCEENRIIERNTYTLDWNNL